MPTTKLLMLQQSHMKDSPITNSTVNPSNSTFVANGGQQNGNTKIVLVSSESMEIDNRNRNTNTTTNSITDEELTSLTWLHDKNLLKGILSHIIIEFDHCFDAKIN